jgi:hypothetical protein
VVAPAIPLPAQADEEPLRGPRVAEEGVDAEAGKTSAQNIDTSEITVSFKFERTAVFDSSAEIVGHTTASPCEFLIARELLLTVALQRTSTTVVQAMCLLGVCK